MTYEDLSFGHRALFAALMGSDPEQSRQLWGLSEEELEAVARRRRALLDFENAIRDLQTVVLESKAISPEEDWVRLKILRCCQFMPAQALYVATFGDEAEFVRLTRSTGERDEPWFLILQYLRATRSPRSATENSRDHLLGYPSEPPETTRGLFSQLVEAVRDSGRGVA